MVILDVDGVLTDGRIIYDAHGIEHKSFDVHDGYGIDRAQRLGLKFSIISGRRSDVVTHRARELAIEECHQGAGDKVAVYEGIRSAYGFKDEEACFIGDDEFDLPLLAAVGLSAAPADAMAAVRSRVDYVAKARGGRGAVREVLDMILKAKKLL